MVRARPDGACDSVHETFSAVAFCSSKEECNATSACRQCSGPWVELEGACVCTGACTTFPFAPSEEGTKAWGAYVRSGAWFPTLAAAFVVVCAVEWGARHTRLRSRPELVFRIRACLTIFTIFQYWHDFICMLHVVKGAFGKPGRFDIFGAFLLTWTPLLLSTTVNFLANPTGGPARKSYTLLEEDHTREDVQCPICLEGCGIRRARMLNCSHEFCEGCITQWSRRSSSCPLCRSDGAL